MLQWSKNNFTFSKKRQLFTLMMNNIKSKSIALCCILLFCGNAFSSELIIHENGFSSAQKLGVLKILKDQQGYAVLTKSGVTKIHNHDVDNRLKKMNNNQLASFLNNGNGRIGVTKFNNGEFKLDMHVHGNGGGALGAALGVIVGKAAVSGLGHGTIYLIASLTGHAAPFVAGALEGTFGPSIELASVHAAAVCGLAGAALTGPV